MPSTTGTTTRLGIVWPAVKFRFDALGRAVPAGWTDTKLDCVGSVAVTLRTAAVTPLAGIPVAPPATWRVTEVPPATFPCGTPRPSRVSISRLGATGTNLMSLTSATTVTARLVDTLPFFAVARTWTWWLPEVSDVDALRAVPAVVTTGWSSTSSSNLVTRELAVLVSKPTVRGPEVWNEAPGWAASPFTVVIFSLAAGPDVRSCSSCGYSELPGHWVLKPSRWPESVLNSYVCFSVKLLPKKLVWVAPAVSVVVPLMSPSYWPSL